VVAEGCYLIASAYVFGRLALSFAALSVDRPMSLWQSWQATQGNGLRLLATYLLAAIGWLAVSLFFGLIAGTLGLSDAAPYTLLLINAVAFAGSLHCW